MMKGVHWEQLFFIVLFVALLLITAAWLLMGKVDILSYVKWRV